MAFPNNLNTLDNIQEKKESNYLSPNDQEKEEAKVKIESSKKECIGETSRQGTGIKSTLNPNAEEWCPSFAYEEMAPLYGPPQFVNVQILDNFFSFASHFSCVTTRRLDVTPEERWETEDYWNTEDEEDEEYEEESQGSNEDGCEQTLEVVESTLNPKANEWFPPSTPVEARTVFMTFSKGFSPTKDQIRDYFMGIYGDVVEDVEIHRRRRGQPEFGEIVFKYSYLSGAILHQRDSVKLQMAGKTFWLDKYKP